MNDRSAPATAAGAAAFDLLTWLCDRLGPADLEAIARADYDTDQPLHLAALRRIVAGDRRPLRPLRWHPREVLELVRWSEPGPHATGEHLRRLFCCTVLLLAALEPADQGRTHSFNASLAAATESIVVAFPEWRESFLALLDALEARGEAFGAERAFLPLARLVVRSPTGAPPEALCAEVERADQLASTYRARSAGLAKAPEGPWGWVLGVTASDQRAKLWRTLLKGVVASTQGDPSYGHVVARLIALRDRRA
ncbi:MAG: hypothetical protein MUF34_37155 [Polyangiaceae bacterium]|jgi:hypothetical protein|nr:hypothetical protein [Polyangiaceae bacterium]